ncbi:transglutaminase-like cysteine peptidase [Agaribacterium sp. ZY112]|uniref:transglutaminase-like cysteine peptidase n=1 Tax=Agaribacterium sp. ZY112 TaxID=3233574 RepID=UPI0035238C5D
MRRVNKARAEYYLRSTVAVLAFVVVIVVADGARQLLDLLTPAFIREYQRTYGDSALERLESWRELIENNQHKNDWVKLNKVNSFFNRKLRYEKDIEHWRVEDYWATPIEFLGSHAGDCEDFTIAKYFTLRALGVEVSKLRLMYVRALSVNEAHMVLIYSESPSDIPLVLDNIEMSIKPANKRRDLKPIYSFNGDGLWLAKARGLGKRVSDSSGVALWQDVISRIESGQLKSTAVD